MSPPIPLPNHCIALSEACDRAARRSKLPRDAAKAHYRGFESSTQRDHCLGRRAFRIESRELAAHRARQGARHLSRRRRAPAHRRDRSHCRRSTSCCRISIPGKGIILTAISNFWFKKLESVVPNHLTGIEPEAVLADPRDHATVKDRAVVVRKLKPLPVEAVVRGYLIGSGWKDYCKNGPRLGRRAAARGSSSRSACASRSSRRARKARGGPARREHLDGRRSKT